MRILFLYLRPLEIDHLPNKCFDLTISSKVQAKPTLVHAFGTRGVGMYSRRYQLLKQEAYLSRSALLYGFDAILKSNVQDTDRGNYYVALFQLSIGIERLLKLTLILEYMIENEMQMIPKAILKNVYSHGILKLYGSCQKTAIKYFVKEMPFVNAGDSEYKMLGILDRFAMSSRYHNTNELSGQAMDSDPLKDWWNEVLTHAIFDCVPSKKRTDLFEETIRECDVGFGNGYTTEIDFNGNIMTRVDVIFMAKVLRIANPYVNWFLVKTLRPVYDILFELISRIDETMLGYGAQSREQIPYLYEFFPFLLLDKKSVLRRRKWA